MKCSDQNLSIYLLFEDAEKSAKTDTLKDKPSHFKEESEILFALFVSVTDNRWLDRILALQNRVKSRCLGQGRKMESWSGADKGGYRVAG